jgi:hypothetical protein
VGHCAGYRVHAVIVRERPAVFGDVGELVVVAVAVSSRRKLSLLWWRMRFEGGSDESV